MKIQAVLALTVALAFAVSGQSEDDFLYGKFPDDFQWGFATAAYQIEGGWNEDEDQVPGTLGRTQNPSPIKDNSTGDVACDSYHKYKEDVQLIKATGATIYRFSISWSRVIPTGRLADGINPSGLRYYNDLINELLANGIEPMATIYHWDLPQPLEDVNGWLNETIVPHFADYARLLYSQYGDRVKKWITINEPWSFCYGGYEAGDKAPGRKISGIGAYLCNHNVLKSHAVAYRIYEAEFKPTQKGLVGYTVYAAWNEPENPNDPEHVAAAERANMWLHGWQFYPIVYGDYPPIMRQLIDSKSESEGLTTSRLPVFTEEWKRMLKGSFDFLGQNYYTTKLVVPAVRLDSSYDGDQNTITYQRPDWPESASNWLKVVPWGFRKLLVWIKATYGNPLVYITENGVSDTIENGVNDTSRIQYYRSHLNEVLKAVVLDGCNIKGYTAWSLLDNFEWAFGYVERFGTHFVDFTSPNRTRTPKASAQALTKIFADNGFLGPNA